MAQQYCVKYIWIFLLTLQICKCLSTTYNIAYFQDTCQFNVEELIQDSSISSSITNNFEYLMVCNIQEPEVYHYFLNTSIDVFVGPVNYKMDQMLLKHALIFHRPYISPYSPLVHFDNQQIFSIGTGFEQTAMAVVTVLNHFQWRHIVILAALDENWMELGSVIFIYLSTDGFSPVIRYLRNIATDNEILGVLEETTLQQKGKAY